MRSPLRRNLVRLVAVSLAIPAAATFGPPTSASADPAPGDVVVVRVGDGSAALSNAATAVFLDEYTPSGTLVRTTALPTASSGANHRLTVSGSATSEGALALSADGQYLTLGGYDADPGLASVAGTTASAVARVVGRVDGGGTVDTSTAITDTFSGGNIRGAVTDDGSRFWAVGSTGGVRLAALGSAGSTTAINSAAPTNIRAVGIAGGRLYISTGSGTTGVYAVGTGLPTTGGQTPALTTAVPSPYAFTALDRDPAVPGVDTLYVADDSASPNGGVLKFSFDGTTWTARGSYRPASSGARGVTGSVTGSTATLFATTSATAASLVKVEDTAAFDAPISVTATTLLTTPANTALRGVAFAPAGAVSTVPSFTTQPQDATVSPGGTATLTAAATGTGPLTYQWYAGTSGDTGTPVGTGTSFTTPALSATASYWVRVTGPAGTADSRTATVTVSVPLPPCTGSVVTIGSVQGTGDISPVAGQTVTVRGTVVGDYEGASPALRGFYLQDAGDANASTSDGIFVFDSGANLVSNGGVVEVTGAVSEFQGQTQITATAANIVSCGTQNTVTPTDVTLPRVSATDLEPYEGMLVRFHQTLSVTEHFQLGRFGQVVLSSGGRLRQPTADIRATDTAAVAAAQQANNLNRLILDDADQSQNPDPIVFGRNGQPLSAANTLRGGDTVTDPVGVLTYTWAGNSASGNAYRLRPINALGGTAVFNGDNPRPAAPPEVGTGSVKVASANLLNFFNTYTGCTYGTQGGPTDCRGATSDLEYQRQLAKEVASLRFMGADVIGYMEMENDGYGSASAVQALTNALNAADGPGTWAFVNPDAATGITDVAGDDAIKAGLLYKTAKVHPVAGKTFVDVNDLFERRPVAQEFETATGARLTVIANHFKSKGSCPTSGPDTDQGDGQSCWNAHRTQQANELSSWIANTVVPSTGDPDVLIVGDLNSYAGEDPIAALEAAGFTNLVKAYHGDEAYSYVFDGQWGYLDYVLASSSLVPQVTGAGDAHHNSDEPSVLDYNTDFKTANQITSLYAPDRFRTSDHDPVLVGIEPGVPAGISGTAPAGTVGDPYAYTFTVTGTAPATVSVSAGDLPPGLSLGANGQLSGSPTKAGSYAFTVKAENAYGSATLPVTVEIGQGVSATTLSASPNPVATGAGLTLTAQVAAAVAATGSVTFSEGSTVLGTAPVAADGTATLTTSTLAAGEHAVTAAFGGSADLKPSTSDTLAVAVIDPATLGGTLPDGTVGSAYSAVVPHTGSATFSVTGGALPPGLTLSPAGTVSGTPADGGAYTFTITATNPVSTVAQAYTLTVAKAATSVTLTASAASPSTVGAALTFTAVVAGPAGFTPEGTVQFAVDGSPVGGPVTLSGGRATSPAVSTLGVGAHTVTATYAGNSAFTGSSATTTQIIQYAIKMITPAAGARFTAGLPVPVAFQLTDAAGKPIPLLDAAALLLTGRVKVSASGAQTLGATTPLYEPVSKTFIVAWLTSRRPAGAATISVTVTYPGAPNQVVSVPITLT